MSGTVVAVNKLTSKDNAAAVGQKIAELVAAKYSGPDWQRQGPNFIRNAVTGETVNLNQEAVAILMSEGERNDAVAVVEAPDGQRQSLFIHEDAVAAAGNDMRVLGRNLQAVLNESGVGGIPPWVAVAGGVAALALFYYMGHHGQARRRR